MAKTKTVDLSKKFRLMRYNDLIEEVKAAEPKLIMEIGTWNGITALEMLKYAPGAKYIGFDLFEEATKETDEQEFNVKAHFSITEVADAMWEKQKDFILVKGNTRETLPAFCDNYLEYAIMRGVTNLEDFKKPDFIFIDGGHSVETIQSDWDFVKQVAAEGATVIFDDYYSPEVEGMGCNKVVKDLKHELLKSIDGTKMGAANRLVKVVL